MGHLYYISHVYEYPSRKRNQQGTLLHYKGISRLIWAQGQDRLQIFSSNVGTVYTAHFLHHHYNTLQGIFDTLFGRICTEHLLIYLQKRSMYGTWLLMSRDH